MSRLPRLMRGSRVALALRLGANGLGQALAAAGIAFATRHIFDAIGAVDVSAFAALLAAALTISVLRFFERVDAEKLGQHYAVEVREQLFRHLLDQRARDVSMRSKGGTLLKFVGDLTALRLWITMGLARLWVMGTTLAGAFAALAVLNARLALVVCLPILLGACAIVFSGAHIRETAREARRHRARLTGDVAERLANLAVVQAFGQSEREWRRVRRRGRVLRDAMVDRARAIGRVRGLAELTTGVATVAALAAGTRGVADGVLSPGTVVAAIAVIGVLSPAVRGLSRTYEYWNGARVSRDFINEFFSRPTVVDITAPDASGIASDEALLGPAIELRDVTVEGALDRVSLKAPAGSVTAIIGANGAGKSTILAAIGGAVKPERGEVLIDGISASDIGIGALRRLCGWVSPELQLLKGTLRRNLKYGDPKMSDEALHARLEAFGLGDVAKLKPDGLDHRVAENGTNLSLGQRQLVGLARTLVLEPAVLLLDEFDANLDPKHREMVAHSIRQFRGTVVMVTHHRETLEWADHVVHLHAGRIVADGPGDSNIVSEGRIAALFANDRAG